MEWKHSWVLKSMVSKIMMDRTDLMEHKTASNYVPLKWKQNMYSQHELRQKDGALQDQTIIHHHNNNKSLHVNIPCWQILSSSAERASKRLVLNIIFSPFFSVDKESIHTLKLISNVKAELCILHPGIIFCISAFYFYL